MDFTDLHAAYFKECLTPIALTCSKMSGVQCTQPQPIELRLSSGDYDSASDELRIITGDKISISDTGYFGAGGFLSWGCPTDGNILAANLAPQIRLLFLVRHHRSAGSNQASESGIPTTIFLVLLPLGIGVGVGVGVGVSLQLKRLKTALYGCGHTWSGM
jgi:hypothetical protein